MKEVSFFWESDEKSYLANWRDFFYKNVPVIYIFENLFSRFMCLLRNVVGVTSRFEIYIFILFLASPVLFSCFAFFVFAKERRWHILFLTFLKLSFGHAKRLEGVVFCSVALKYPFFACVGGFFFWRALFCFGWHIGGIIWDLLRMGGKRFWEEYSASLVLSVSLMNLRR